MRTWPAPYRDVIISDVNDRGACCRRRFASFASCFGACAECVETASCVTGRVITMRRVLSRARGGWEAGRLAGLPPGR